MDKRHISRIADWNTNNTKCYVLSSGSSQNSCVWALTLNVTVFEDRAFKEVIKIIWDHKCEALIQ